VECPPPATTDGTPPRCPTTIGSQALRRPAGPRPRQYSISTEQTALQLLDYTSLRQAGETAQRRRLNCPRNDPGGCPAPRVARSAAIDNGTSSRHLAVLCTAQPTLLPPWQGRDSNVTGGTRRSASGDCPSLLAAGRAVAVQERHPP
jgi:hypothetical protein